MFNKKRTTGFILVFSILFLCRSSSYAQPGSVRDTTYEVISCCVGSVPDTAYAAEIMSDNSSKQPARITFYRIYCKTCCFILPSGQKTLPKKDKVTNPELIKKLREVLKKQLEHNLKVVNTTKY
ncbi:hypothetical protein A3860_09490 [Niastella vici]|uniref:TRASH transcription regulator C-terminal archaeal domain-containing protein n=1 Tax=Niastella vici TaxID=1703345 RepID=A0A1V9FEL8_9BACT|nr:hypothetical protein [Niastella vici]OQP56808.1 hypothetical protein A3860_09490 [Niastella vici]